jgi:hypothetical protein
MTAIAGMLAFAGFVAAAYYGLSVIWDHTARAWDRVASARDYQGRPVGHWDRDYNL